MTGLSAAAWSALPGFAFAQGSANRSGPSRDLAALTLKQASDLVRRRDASPVELTEACLARIEQDNPAINAFITVTREQALAAAREMVRREIRKVFATVDVLITPTQRGVAQSIAPAQPSPGGGRGGLMLGVKAASLGCIRLVAVPTCLQGCVDPADVQSRELLWRALR